MRSLLSCCLAVLIFPSSTIPQATGGHVKPPGITTADTLSNQPLEPPLKPGARQINVDQVNAETKELQTLADALPAQIRQVESNQLPKDLETNLRQIEKLAKHLRSQLTP